MVKILSCSHGSIITSRFLELEKEQSLVCIFCLFLQFCKFDAWTQQALCNKIYCNKRVTVSPGSYFPSQFSIFSVTSVFFLLCLSSALWSLADKDIKCQNRCPSSAFVHCFVSTFFLSVSIFSLSFVVWLNWLLRMSDHMFFSCLDRKTSHRWSWSSCRPLWTKWASLKILGCSAPNLLKLMWDPMAVTVVCIVLIVNVVLSPEVTRLHYYLSNGCHCWVHCLNRYVILGVV